MIFKQTFLSSMIIMSLVGCSTSGQNESFSSAAGPQPMINQQYLEDNPDAIKQARERQAQLAQVEMEEQLKAIRAANETRRLEEQEEQARIKAEAQKAQLLEEQEQARIRAQTAELLRKAEQEETRLAELKQKQNVLRAEKAARVAAVTSEEERRAQAELARKEFMEKAPTYYVFPGESYQTAIARWLRSEGIQNIAWANDSNLLDALERTYPTDAEIWPIKAYIHDAITELKTQTDVLVKADLSVTLDRTSQTAAVHPWKNRRVQITYVNGHHLSDAVKQVVLAYGWHWNDMDPSQPNNPQRSWRPSFELPFGSPYPIVTPEGDISAALDIVLNAYPVKAARLDSTRHIYINEEK